MKGISFPKFLFFVFCVIIININILMAQKNTPANDNKITVDEDRSEYFRNEITSNLTKSQILSYLVRKEAAERSAAFELGAKYLLGLTPPFDRKIDPAIGENWQKLTASEKDFYRYEWFQKNRNAVSTRELQQYIMIDDLVLKARDAEKQRRLREQRERINFADTMSDSEFLVSLDRFVKKTNPPSENKKIDKIEVKQPPQPEKENKIIAQTKSSKNQPVKKSKKQTIKEDEKEKQLSAAIDDETSGKSRKKTLKTKSKKQTGKKSGKSKTKLQSKISKNTQLEKKAETLTVKDDIKVKPREIDETEIKKSKEVEFDSDKAFDEKIKTIQSKISSLRSRIGATEQEFDNLRNKKTKNSPAKEEENQHSEQLKKIDTQKKKLLVD